MFGSKITEGRYTGMQMERRKPTPIQFIKDVLLSLLALIVAPVLGWLLLQAVQVQKDVVAMRLDLAYHISSRNKDMNENSSLHHRKQIIPCTGCHEK